MTALNRWVCRNVVRESATQNVEGERVGGLNRISGYVYRVRLVGKRMKAWNRQVHYVVKYLMLASILGGILATAF